jgi:hypothetical protein
VLKDFLSNRKMGISLSVGYFKVFGDRNIEEHENSKKCSICLDIITNRCLTDICRHEFCFQCLHQWSQEHSFCPLCRQRFQVILHNFQTENRFDVFLVENNETIIRRELILRRNTIRNQLQNIRTEREQEFRNSERILDRVIVDISRIDSISGQNNEQLEQTLNEIVRNLNSYIMNESTIDRIINLRATQTGEEVLNSSNSMRTFVIGSETGTAIDRIINLRGNTNQNNSDSLSS